MPARLRTDVVCFHFGEPRWEEWQAEGEAARGFALPHPRQGMRSGFVKSRSKQNPGASPEKLRHRLWYGCPDLAQGSCSRGAVPWRPFSVCPQWGSQPWGRAAGPQGRVPSMGVGKAGSETAGEVLVSPGQG